MQITLLQTDPVWADRAANLRRADELVDAHPGSQLYVLPEMFATGFATEPEGMAEPEGGVVLGWMQRKAAATGAALAGSVATLASDGRYVNRFYFVRPDGGMCFYDKHHLFTHGGEHHRYTAGQQRVVVEWMGWRILLQVCYDLRFPVFSRNRGDYDLALYVASWPEPRQGAWDTLLRARAIENQCYVAGVNRAGTDPSCHYVGGTALVDAYGRTVADCRHGREDLCTAVLDRDGLCRFRQKFPVLHDAD